MLNYKGINTENKRINTYPLYPTAAFLHALDVSSRFGHPLLDNGNRNGQQHYVQFL